MVTYISLSDDFFMIVNTKNGFIYIYNFTTQFNQIDKGEYNFMMPKRSFISSDHMYVILSEYNYFQKLMGRYASHIHIFKYDVVKGKYFGVKRIDVTGIWINYVSLSEDLTFMFIAGNAGSMLVS